MNATQSSIQAAGVQSPKLAVRRQCDLMGIYKSFSPATSYLLQWGVTAVMAHLRVMWYFFHIMKCHGVLEFLS